MPSGSVLELATLPERHPRVGDALLKLFGAQVVLRLCIDPVLQPWGALKRRVMVERKGPATGGKRVEEVWEIGGEGLADFSEDYCVRVGRTVNAQRITEDAAIGVMALLIHELEGVTIREVLPIGSGGDYLIEFEKAAGPMQVEVSGIREDPAGKQAELRLAQKCAQVLQHSSCGYASVTNFHRLTDGTVHSYLHYVEEKKGRRKRQAKAKKKGRRG